jgi:orotate phosphoribosyltransferase
VVRDLAAEAGVALAGVALAVIVAAVLDTPVNPICAESNR